MCELIKYKPVYIFKKIINIVYYLIWGNFRFLFKYIYNVFKKNELCTLKNSESGRCFIIGTAPSLRIDELKRLSAEKTLGVNNICSIFETISYETNYYCIQDFAGYQIIKDNVDRIRHAIILQALTYTKSIFDIFKSNPLAEHIEFPLYLGSHMFSNNTSRLKFSSESNKIVYDGYTVIYSAIQLAVYLGFSEIYLMGVDCHYSPSRLHFKNQNSDSASNINDIKLNRQSKRMREALLIARNHAEKLGVKIYNVSSDSPLDLFEKRNLNNVINNYS
jgi:hypothetical protein